jgi:hypothetical protein
MFKLLLLTVFAFNANTGVLAGIYGGGLALAGGYAGLAAAPALQADYGQTYNYGPLEAAIHSRRTVQIIPVPYARNLHAPQVIEVLGEQLPVQIHFRSISSPVSLLQSHETLPGRIQHSSSQDEPHKLVHEVVKPVIQEVREVIQPYRRVIQEIRPVLEEVNTLVHKGESHQRVAIQQEQVLAEPALPLAGGYGGAQIEAALPALPLAGGYGGAQVEALPLSGGYGGAQVEAALPLSGGYGGAQTTGSYKARKASKA